MFITSRNTPLVISLLFVSPLKYFWAPKPNGRRLFEMYMTQFTSAEEEFVFLCPMFLQQYIPSPPCVIETPPHLPSSVNTEAREYIPGMFICFMEGGRPKKTRGEQTER